MARVLIIGKYYHPFEGGIEANTASVARLLAQTNDVTALVNCHSQDCRDEVIDGVKVIRRRVDLNVKSQPVSLGFFKGIKLSDYDVIHFHAPNPYASMLLWARLLLGRVKTPLVITHHMEIYGRKALRSLSIGFYRWLARHARSVIVTSKKNADISQDLPGGITPTVIPLGIAADKYRITDETRTAGRAWRRELTGDAPVVGFLGRHARYKGLDILLQALAQLPGVHALIAGDGPERAAAERMTVDLGLTDRVRFLGKINDRDKLKMLSSIDVFAFPSTEITEAFGVSQLEAMLCGAPVVATDLPTGVTDVAIHEKTALLAAHGSVSSLVEQIARMLNDRVLAQALAIGGREHVLANMNESVVARQTCDVIERAARGGSSGKANIDRQISGQVERAL
jgi:glycosyltransferase involved in cell wall biosynthesis